MSDARVSLNIEAKHSALFLHAAANLAEGLQGNDEMLRELGRLLSSVRFGSVTTVGSVRSESREWMQTELTDPPHETRPSPDRVPDAREETQSA